MRKKSAGQIFIAGMFFLLMLCCLTPGDFARGETFFGTPATGVMELSEYHYPVFLFVPDNYKGEREYTLVISIPDEGESPKDNLDRWRGIAKRRSMIVLSPTNLWPKDTPYTVDEWILKIRKDITQRYRIGRGKIFLIGTKAGAHYAAYLGVKYPEEFSAIGLLGGAWPGKFDALVRPASRAVKQRPFFIAIPADDEALYAAVEKRAADFVRKGYLVYLEKAVNAEHFSSDEFRKQFFDWLEEKAEVWRQVVAESQKSWKEKTIGWMENHFRV